MSQTVTLQDLQHRLVQLEAEFADFRREVADLRRQAPPDSPDAGLVPRIQWADRDRLRRAFDQLFTSLGITGEPQGIEALQQRMSKAGLEPNELSRGLIEMRDE